MIVAMVKVIEAPQGRTVPVVVNLIEVPPLPQEISVQVKVWTSREEERKHLRRVKRVISFD